MFVKCSADGDETRIQPSSEFPGRTQPKSFGLGPHLLQAESSMSTETCLEPAIAE